MLATEIKYTNLGEIGETVAFTGNLLKGGSVVAELPYTLYQGLGIKTIYTMPETVDADTLVISLADQAYDGLLTIEGTSVNDAVPYEVDIPAGGGGWTTTEIALPATPVPSLIETLMPAIGAVISLAFLGIIIVPLSKELK